MIRAELDSTMSAILFPCVRRVILRVSVVRRRETLRAGRHRSIPLAHAHRARTMLGPSRNCTCLSQSPRPRGSLGVLVCSSPLPMSPALISHVIVRPYRPRIWSEDGGDQLNVRRRFPPATHWSHRCRYAVQVSRSQVATGRDVPRCRCCQFHNQSSVSHTGELAFQQPHAAH